MPGIPQGRDINESGAKSVTLVTIGDDGAIAIAQHRTSTAQFERVSVDLSGIEDWSEAMRAIGRRLGAQSLPQISGLSRQTKELIATMRDKARLLQACSITKASFAEADYRQNSFEIFDPRWQVITDNYQCCTTLVAKLGADATVPLLSKLKVADGGPVAAALTVGLVNAFVKGELKELQREIQSAASPDEQVLVNVCLPTVAFAAAVTPAPR